VALPDEAGAAAGLKDHHSQAEVEPMLAARAVLQLRVDGWRTSATRQL